MDRADAQLADQVAQAEAEEEGEDGKPIRNPRAYVNPEILAVSEEEALYNEGCLSIPEQYAEVARPVSCRVRWLDRDGTSHEADMDGLLATCMQHEIDHLNGVLFIDHISRLKRDMLLKKLIKRACACEQAPEQLRSSILTRITYERTEVGYEA